eukprot:jgi/Hompol1/6722/HPOL_002321-RA
MSANSSVASNNRLSRPFSTLKVSYASEYVLHVEFARTKKLNSMDLPVFIEIGELFDHIKNDGSVRAVVISAAIDSKVFSAGLDFGELKQALSSSSSDSGAADVARAALNGFMARVGIMQHAFTAIESCNKPVIAAVHGACIGAGIDLITACDLRFCAKDSTFCVKEVDIGIAADLGTLQRLPKVVGNHSWVRDICLTARTVSCEEAMQFGLVSRVFDDKEQLIAGALEVAKLIATKSPVAVSGTKHVLNFSRDRSVQEGLDYVLLWNALMTNSQDTMLAAKSVLSKRPAVFPKL